MWGVQPFVLKKLNLINGTNHRKMQFSLFHLSSLFCEKPNTIFDSSKLSYKCLWKSIETLWKEKQSLVFERNAFVFQKNITHFHILALSVHKICNARKYSRKVIAELSCAKRTMLIETMLGVIEKVILTKIASFYRNDSWSYASFDNFRVGSFKSKSFADTRVAFCK